MIELDDIAPEFNFLLSKGFVLKSSVYCQKEFGNASLEICGAIFSVRLERDRGQLFVDLGSDSTGWYKLEYLIEFLDGSIANEFAQLPEPKILANLLETHWCRVVDLMTDTQKRADFQEFAKKKSTSLLRLLFGNA
ncbi:MAG: hypothetical protein WKG03_07760 [Telluria sp.]